MVPFIATALDEHQVSSRDDYQRRHRARIAKSRNRATVHVVDLPAYAYISANRWVIDCECGAGNAAHPDWPEACCFACGAVHTRVVFPDNRKALEAVLLKRPQVMTRHWRPGETVSSLRAENVAHGVEP